MNKSRTYGILLVGLLGLTACGDNSKKAAAEDVPPVEEMQSTLSLAGVYKVSLQCVDEEAQKHMPKIEGQANFKEGRQWEMTFKLTEACNWGCTYFSTGSYKANEQQLVMLQTYRKDMDRNEENRKELKMPMKIQSIDEKQTQLVVIQDATSNQCEGPMIISFMKQKEEFE